MSDHDLYIYPDGTIHTIYRDDLGLDEIGKLTVTRASHVEFDNAAQEWVITLPDGTLFARGFKRREDALMIEAAYVKGRLARMMR